MIALITLTFSHLTLKLFGFSQKISNLITCTMFQLYFLLNCQNLIFNEIYSGKSDVESTVSNIMLLKDYFIYDILYLVIYRRDLIFIVHHILSLTLITFGYLQDIHSTFMYNLISYVHKCTMNVHLCTI